MLGAARKTEVVITHTPHRQYSSAFAVPMFGRAEFGFTLDGERTPYTFGKDPTPQFYYTATQDGDDAVRMRFAAAAAARSSSRRRFFSAS